MLLILLLLWTMQLVFGEEASPEIDLPFTELANSFGYETEEHFVNTDDGYILRMFRLPLQKGCTESKGVIMFMHGLYLSSDDCLIPGPGVAHCTTYADNCYDVWAPNIRGNVYSRNHTTYNPNKDSQFWDFCIDDMSKYDLPAVINYTLTTTNNTELSYVGHAQGVALLLILCSKVPEYNDKIKIGFGLSATTSLEHSKFIVVQAQSFLAPFLEITGGLLNREILPRGGLGQLSGQLLCGVSKLSYPICSYLIFAFLGYNKYQITDEVLKRIVGRAPSGTSLKNFKRWGDMRNGFREYDYGKLKNMADYGQAHSPLFNLSNVTMPWLIIASHGDNVANITDVRQAALELPNASLRVLSDESFGHLDFIYGKSIPNYITSVILATLQNNTA